MKILIQGPYVEPGESKRLTVEQKSFIAAVASKYKKQIFDIFFH